jgi:hypothetical protein
MATLALTTPPSRSIAQWSSRLIIGFLVLFLGFDSIIKIIQHPEAVTPTVGFGFAAALVPILGVMELACFALYLIPRTSVIGAILMTGYLGGALATQVRVDAPLFSLLFPFIIGALLWGALLLRDAHLRNLLLSRPSHS